MPLSRDVLKTALILLRRIRARKEFSRLARFYGVNLRHTHRLPALQRRVADGVSKSSKPGDIPESSPPNLSSYQLKER